jgi:hypothetical protein
MAKSPRKVSGVDRSRKAQLDRDVDSPMHENTATAIKPLFDELIGSRKML